MQRTLERVLRSFSSNGKANCFKTDPKFLSRLNEHFEQLLRCFHELYGNQFDFYPFFEELIHSIYESWEKRDPSLKKLDKQREANPNWFKSEKMVGAVCYVDLFAKDLAGIEEKISYLEELGITYLHLMPLFKSPDGENDGGYAVSSYRKVDEGLGTIGKLKKLITKLRKKGISVVLDFINNHTSNEHKWARLALDGNEKFKEFYHFFPDRSVPDAYDAHLREIFPEVRKGSFTQLEKSSEWVWTTFHSYQWDLNYKNPEVFISMAKEMLFLANLGVEILRLDAVPFTWKQLGTTCKNLPQAHTLIKVLNAVTRIAAPSLLFKSEAIVHPEEVQKYIAKEECQLSYNPEIMALLWESLATREVKLLEKALKYRFNLSNDTAWVNYIRSHDDIGWTFSDDDASQLGIHGYEHRQFLNRFYLGDFPGSFSQGAKFQFNPQNNDMRICGTAASLAGLELALEQNDEGRIHDAIKRMQLLYGMAMCVGGIPLIYLGDEVGVLNDYSYTTNKAKKDDTRWIHRVPANWNEIKKAKQGKEHSGEIYKKMSQLIRLRKEHPAFGSGQIEVLTTDNPHILVFKKEAKGDRVIVIANFSELNQLLSRKIFHDYKLEKELLTEKEVGIGSKMELKGYDLLWIACK